MQSAALRRSEAYLAETQRLTGTGSFAIEVESQAVTYSSAEHSRLYGFDPGRGLPSIDDFFSRIHPEDRAMCMEAMSKGIRDLTDVEVEYRVLIPGRLPRIVHAFGHPVAGESGQSVEIVGTIVDVTERREAEALTARVSEEQAALRRVATLVARGVEAAELFLAVSGEVGRMFGTDMAAVGRFDPDGPAHVVVGLARTFAGVKVGSRWPLHEKMTVTEVYRTGRSARIDATDWSGVDEPIGVAARELRAVSSVSSPVMVEGRVWGAITVTAREPLPRDVEQRLGKFTELIGTAVANAESRAALSRLADEKAASGARFRVLAEEQAALRRVATLVARGVTPEEVFAAVAEEVGRVMPVEYQHLGRFEPDGMVNFVAARGSGEGLLPVGTRLPLGGDNVTTRVFETGRPARTDYANPAGPIDAIAMERSIRWSVGTPIIVEGCRWGVMIVSSTKEQPPPDTEQHLTQFMELLATAIANADSRAGLARLAEEQAALRRVATLVARGVPPEEVFAAVVEEVEQLLGSDTAAMIRFESDGTRTVIAISGRQTHLFPVGQRVELGGRNVSTLVFETGRPARLDSYADASGSLGVTLRENGMRRAVGAPILVEGRLWGAMIAGSVAEHPLPAGTETRLVSFTELVATAVANAESRAALAASRARIVAAADASRRQIRRDLHDGAQQRLVHTVIGLKLASRALDRGDANATELVAEALRQAEEANSELRELAHGILPAALTDTGLRGGLDALVSRIPLPVTVHVSVERLPAGVEATAYFIVSEALTNVLKHANANHAVVTVHAEDRRLQVEIGDDGIGGADPQRGSGLIGLSDRVEALGGTLQLTSPSGRGTTLLIRLPIEEATSNRPAQR